MLAPAIVKLLNESQAALAISSVSVYEAALQIRRGRVEVDLSMNEWLHAATTEADIEILPVDAAIATSAAALPPHHGDPLDRIIIATAIHYDAMLVSVDGQFPHYKDLAGRLTSNNGLIL